MTSSHCWLSLRGATAQNVTRRLTIASLIRSASASQRSSRYSSSAPSAPNTIAPPSVSYRATPIANIPTLTLPTLDIFVLASSSLSAPTVAVPTTASTEELFNLFMQTYMGNIKNQAQAWVQVLTFPVLVEPKEQSLKARFLNIYFGKLHMDYYWFCQQYKDHFNSTRANKENCTLFAPSFLQIGINTYWI